jgi:hypothetical protein
LPKEKCTVNVICNSETGVLTEFTRDLVNNLIFKQIKHLSEAEEGFRLANDQDDLKMMSHLNLTHRGTFANALQDDRINSYLMNDIGTGCGQFLQQIYKSGDTLWSYSLYKAAKPITEIPFASGPHAPIFYHYTRAQQFVDLLHPEITDRSKANALSMKDGSYDKIFEFYRTRPADMYRLWRRVHYLAEDPSTSAFEGNLKTVFHLNPQARTIQWNDNIWTKAMEEVNARHPGLDSACGISLNVPVNDSYGAVNFNELLFLIAEDSEIDVIDYNQQEHWFQLVGPRSITSVDTPR